MDAVGNAAVFEVFEGDQVRPDWTCVLEGSGLFPAEGLAGGEGEGKRELGLGEVEREPFWGIRVFVDRFELSARDWWGFGLESSMRWRRRFFTRGERWRSSCSLHCRDEPPDFG